MNLAFGIFLFSIHKSDISKSNQTLYLTFIIISETWFGNKSFLKNTLHRISKLNIDGKAWISLLFCNWGAKPILSQQSNILSIRWEAFVLSDVGWVCSCQTRSDGLFLMMTECEQTICSQWPWNFLELVNINQSGFLHDLMMQLFSLPKEKLVSLKFPANG